MSRYGGHLDQKCRQHCTGKGKEKREIVKPGGKCTWWSLHEVTGLSRFDVEFLDTPQAHESNFAPANLFHNGRCGSRRSAHLTFTLKRVGLLISRTQIRKARLAQLQQQRGGGAGSPSQGGQPGGDEEQQQKYAF